MHDIHTSRHIFPLFGGGVVERAGHDVDDAVGDAQAPAPIPITILNGTIM